MSNPNESTEPGPDSGVPRVPSHPSQPSTRNPHSGKLKNNYVEYVDLRGDTARFDLDRLKTWPRPGRDWWFGRGQRDDEILCRVIPAAGGAARWVLIYVTLEEGDESTFTLTELESFEWGKNPYGGGPTARELTPDEAAEWLERNERPLPDDLDPAPPFDASEPPAYGRLRRDWQPGQAPVVRTPRVVLRGRSERPLVNGVETDRLNDPQYDVIQALLDAGESGLSKERLIQTSRHTDAVNVLKRLAAEDPWKSVIQLAVRRCRGYRLA